MITFDTIQAEVFAAAKDAIAQDLDLSEGSSSYFLFNSQAAVLLEDQQQFDGLKNSWNVNSNIGIDQDINTGFLLNLKRNYTNFNLNTNIINNSNIDYILTTSYQAIYVLDSVNYYFSPLITAPVTIAKNGGSAAIKMIYIGLTFSGLPEIPVGTLLENTASTDLTITTVSKFSPELESDESYRVRQQTIYLVKGYGTPNSLRYGISSSPYIDYSEVYIGTNPEGKTVVQGYSTNYELNYGQILAIVDSPYINNNSVQKVIATQISNLKDLLNTTYVHNPELPNQIAATVTLDNGQEENICFYKVLQNNISIVITIESKYVLFNDSDVLKLIDIIGNYVRSVGIGKKIYSSYISDLISNYFGSNINVVNFSINGSGGIFSFSQQADQIFNLASLVFVYSES
jgi:hypothetical protein